MLFSSPLRLIVVPYRGNDDLCVYEHVDPTVQVRDLLAAWHRDVPTADASAPIHVYYEYYMPYTDDDPDLMTCIEYITDGSFPLDLLRRKPGANCVVIKLEHGQVSDLNVQPGPGGVPSRMGPAAVMRQIDLEW